MKYFSPCLRSTRIELYVTRRYYLQYSANLFIGFCFFSLKFYTVHQSFALLATVSSNLWRTACRRDFFLEILLSISQSFVKSPRIASKTLDLTPTKTPFVNCHDIQVHNSLWSLYVKYGNAAANGRYVVEKPQHLQVLLLHNNVKPMKRIAFILRYLVLLKSRISCHRCRRDIQLVKSTKLFHPQNSSHISLPWFLKILFLQWLLQSET